MAHSITVAEVVKLINTVNSNTLSTPAWAPESWLCSFTTDHCSCTFISFLLLFPCLVSGLQLATISLAGTSWGYCLISPSKEWSPLHRLNRATQTQRRGPGTTNPPGTSRPRYSPLFPPLLPPWLGCSWHWLLLVARSWTVLSCWGKNRWWKICHSQESSDHPCSELDRIPRPWVIINRRAVRSVPDFYVKLDLKQRHHLATSDKGLYKQIKEWLVSTRMIWWNICIVFIMCKQLPNIQFS